MGRPNRKGRSDGHFIMVLDAMQDSPAWQATSGTAIKLLLRLLRMSKGNNGYGNDRDRGRLFLSERDAAAALDISRNTAKRAFQELIDHGFLREVAKGSFDVKRLATTWRLTCQPYPHQRLGPTNEWRKWQPTKKRQAQFLTSPGSNSDTSGSIFEPIDEKSGAKTLPAIGSISEPHIHIPQGVEATAGPDGSTAKVVPIKKPCSSYSFNERSDNRDAAGGAPSAVEVRARVNRFKEAHPNGALGRLANVAGVSQPIISNLRCAGRKPSDETLAKIARALPIAEAAEAARLVRSSGAARSPDAERLRMMDPNVRAVFEAAEARQ